MTIKNLISDVIKYKAMRIPSSAAYIAYRIMKEAGKWINRKIEDSNKKK